MIKKFFAKLMNMEWGPPPKFDKNRFDQENALQKQLAEERRQRNLKAMTGRERLQRQTEDVDAQTKKDERAA